MIIRPLEPPAPATTGGNFIPAWHAVEPLQRKQYEACWIITQPSHAALAGEIASRLSGDAVPKLEADLVRAIALHDAGWGMPDAQAVMRSRAVSQTPPKSFLQVTVPEFLVAWTQSIEIAQSTSPAGAYMVSRHFWRLAGHRLASSGDSQQDRSRLQEFATFESARQNKLAGKQNRSQDELEKLADVLQFCDLMSLYLCCGSCEAIEFPQFFGVKARMTFEAGGYRLDPALIANGTIFTVAALRHPATKQQSGREISFTML